jgi:hypothetical protein
MATVRQVRQLAPFVSQSAKALWTVIPISGVPSASVLSPIVHRHRERKLEHFLQSDPLHEFRAGRPWVTSQGPCNERRFHGDV